VAVSLRLVFDNSVFVVQDSGAINTRSLIFIIVSVTFKSIVFLEGHDHCVVIVAFMDEVDFAEDEYFTFNGFTVVVEFHVDFVVGKNAHAVDFVAVYGFGEFGETSFFVKYVGGSVEATILREDWVHLWLHNLGVQSEGVGYRLVLIEMHLRSKRR